MLESETFHRSFENEDVDIIRRDGQLEIRKPSSEVSRVYLADVQSLPDGTKEVKIQGIVPLNSLSRDILVKDLHGNVIKTNAYPDGSFSFLATTESAPYNFSFSPHHPDYTFSTLSLEITARDLTHTRTKNKKEVPWALYHQHEAIARAAQLLLLSEYDDETVNVNEKPELKAEKTEVLVNRPEFIYTDPIWEDDRVKITITNIGGKMNVDDRLLVRNIFSSETLAECPFRALGTKDSTTVCFSINTDYRATDVYLWIYGSLPNKITIPSKPLKRPYKVS